MYRALSTGAIGVKASSLAQEISFAVDGGFEGAGFDAREIADLIDAQGIDRAREMFTSNRVLPAVWGIPSGWNGEEGEWRGVLADLPRLAEAAASVGGDRVITWIWSGSNERNYDANRAFHVERLTPIARELGNHGCRLGLEFLGPKTLRDQFQYPFISTMSGMLELAGDIGPNVGLLLDSWHWYTSGGTVEQLESLRAEQVVVVHVADAPAGIPVDQQVDNVRALPGATGMIDIASFLRRLSGIGYDGPVVAEPMRCGLDQLPSDKDRVMAVKAAMDDVFHRAAVDSLPDYQ